jgi:hypothetical protein
MIFTYQDELGRLLMGAYGADLRDSDDGPDECPDCGPGPEDRLARRASFPDDSDE